MEALALEEEQEEQWTPSSCLAVSRPTPGGLKSFTDWKQELCAEVLSEVKEQMTTMTKTNLDELRDSQRLTQVGPRPHAAPGPNRARPRTTHNNAKYKWDSQGRPVCNICEQVSGPPQSDATKRNPDFKMTGDFPIVNVQVEDVDIRCLVDTGSQVTLLSEIVCNEFLKHKQVRGSEHLSWLTLRAANGLTIPYVGYIFADFQVCRVSFIQGFSKIAKPLNKLLVGTGRSRGWHSPPIQWTDQCEAAFQQLKQELLQAPILAYTDYTPLYCLH